MIHESPPVGSGGSFGPGVVKAVKTAVHVKGIAHDSAVSGGVKRTQAPDGTVVMLQFAPGSVTHAIMYMSPKVMVLTAQAVGPIPGPPEPTGTAVTGKGKGKRVHEGETAQHGLPPDEDVRTRTYGSPQWKGEGKGVTDMVVGQVNNCHLFPSRGLACAADWARYFGAGNVKIQKFRGMQDVPMVEIPPWVTWGLRKIFGANQRNPLVDDRKGGHQLVKRVW